MADKHLLRLRRRLYNQRRDLDGALHAEPQFVEREADGRFAPGTTAAHRERIGRLRTAVVATEREVVKASTP
jgi:hypothetical protein